MGGSHHRRVHAVLVQRLCRVVSKVANRPILDCSKEIKMTRTPQEDPEVAISGRPDDGSASERGPMRGATFSVLAPGIGLAVVIFAIAWQQCRGPAPDGSASEAEPEASHRTGQAGSRAGALRFRHSH